MMDILPKVLVKALAQLCEEDILSSWNIGSCNNVTTVSIKFMKPDHIHPPPSCYRYEDKASVTHET